MGLVNSLYTSTPTITAAAYTAVKLLGGLLTIPADHDGLIEGVIITDKAKQSSAIDVIFFSGKPQGTFTDTGTFDPTAADLLLIMGHIKVAAADYSIFANNSVACTRITGMPFTAGTSAQNAGRNLFACLACRGTPTYASTSDIQLTVMLTVDQF